MGNKHEIMRGFQVFETLLGVNFLQSTCKLGKKWKEYIPNSKSCSYYTHYAHPEIISLPFQFLRQPQISALFRLKAPAKGENMLLEPEGSSVWVTGSYCRTWQKNQHDVERNDEWKSIGKLYMNLKTTQLHLRFDTECATVLGT